MYVVLRSIRKSFAMVAVVLSAIWLVACDPVTTGGGPSINTSKPVPVALLVPGGSAQAGDDVLARSLENAARLAMADLDGVTIDLRVYNTAGQPTTAAEMAKKAVADGAKIILGPVFAQSANAAGVAVAARNINVLSFSNNTSIAGNNVFVLGNTFQNTANRLASYAVQNGKQSFVVVQADDTAGNAGGTAVQNAVSQNGGNIVAVASHPFSQQGVIDSVPGIAQSVTNSSADAVFFTSDTAGALPLFTQLLPENGVNPTKVQFIGLTRWDIPQSTLSLPGVQGGWFAMPDPSLRTSFQTRYSAAYGESPHPIAGLAYDGIAAIGALVSAGKADALTKTALTQSSGFVGVNGIFRLLANGTNERALAVAQILENQVVLIDPAPRSFGSAGF